MSLQHPTFLSRLADPSIQTVLLCGCGGGFDFVHSIVLYPELQRLGKSVIIGSYSFGDPAEITGDAPVVFDEEGAIAKRVTAASVPPTLYGPEVHVCSFLDARYPSSAPHSVYAYYARAFTVSLLTRLYQQFVTDHSIDAIILVDGGSDSLMAGDEEGLGDPIEDAVSVATVASLTNLKLRVLINVGLGADRFNGVSDSASLRAVAELTDRGGYMGAMSLEPTNTGFQFYSDCIDHIYQRQTFRSVLAGTIISAVKGYYGGEDVPPLLQTRVDEAKFFLWPLMTVLWAFDVSKVAERSMIADWIRDCPTPGDCYLTLHESRKAHRHSIRGAENLPRHEDMRFDSSRIW